MCSFGSLQHLLEQRRVKRGKKQNEKKKTLLCRRAPTVATFLSEISTAIRQTLTCNALPSQNKRNTDFTVKREHLGDKKRKKNTFSNLSFPSSLKDLFAACEASICTWLSFIVSVPDSNKHRRGESSFSPAVSLSLFFFNNPAPGAKLLVPQCHLLTESMNKRTGKATESHVFLV